MTDTRRVLDLIAEMTLREKLAQLVGVWVDAGSGAAVAPLQDAMAGEVAPFEQFAEHGLGQITRFYGTAPVDPVAASQVLRERQRWLRQHTRLGIPAVVHEECLTGLVAWQATTFPVPLSWGAAFDPELVEEMAAGIGSTMRSLGVHQGLAPLFDVVRDARWGRVEECISEDPYLVGVIGSSYVRGLQSAGVIATLKHFVGYSASRAGRNLAPVGIGRRELADVLLPPFEMAVRDAGAQSVMNSYSEIDGLPAAASRELLTDILRDQWGFDGVVVADYFAIAFLASLHQVAGDLGDAAGQALAAGIDVELPTGNAYLAPLEQAVLAGDVDESLVDRAVLRVLRQKEQLGLLDQTFDDEPTPPGPLDPAGHRKIAARLAEESLVLLSNDGTLPVSGVGRIAVLGPNADRATALFGCYSFANHVLDSYPGTALGIAAPTVLESLRAEYPDAEVSFAAGCGVDDDDRSQIAAAVHLAAQADVAIVVVGDQAGLFGRGTSGEGCDTDTLELPGVQRELVEAVVATGTPVVLVLLTGRPYAVGWALDSCAAAVQAFFPGEEGGRAIAAVLSGRVNPSGRLPVSLPESAAAQPYSYLHPVLGGRSNVSNLDPAPVRPFGFGLSYTSFEYRELTVDEPAVATDAAIGVSVLVTNTGPRGGADVVQLYGHDVVASITRPVAQLLGFHRIWLEPGESARIRFSVPTTRLAFSDRNYQRVVEPGRVELWVGTSCTDRAVESAVELTGPIHAVTSTDSRWVSVSASPSEPVATGSIH